MLPAARLRPPWHRMRLVNDYEEDPGRVMARAQVDVR